MQGQPLLTLDRKDHHNTSVFSRQSMRKLEGIMHIQTFEAESSLFWEGGKADKLFYLIQGQVKMTKTSTEGKEFTLHLFQEGDLVGELAGFNDLNHNYNGIVTKVSTVGVIQLQDLELLLWQYSDLAVEFIKWMSLVNRITDTKLRDLMFHGKPGALCSTLIRMMNTFGRATEHGILIEQKLTNSEFGELIGATRESVNRMLKDLTQKGVIEQRKGYILIKDLTYLRDICHCEDCPVTVCRM
jgi:CRP/FNR family cyclic AMP-dependent transcriptional regulator